MLGRPTMTGMKHVSLANPSIGGQELRRLLHGSLPPGEKESLEKIGISVAALQSALVSSRSSTAENSGLTGTVKCLSKSRSDILEDGAYPQPVILEVPDIPRTRLIVSHVAH